MSYGGLLLISHRGSPRRSASSFAHPKVSFAAGQGTNVHAAGIEDHEGRLTVPPLTERHLGGLCCAIYWRQCNGQLGM